jgi:hypothetical protein
MNLTKTQMNLTKTQSTLTKTQTNLTKTQGTSKIHAKAHDDAHRNTGSLTNCLDLRERWSMARCATVVTATAAAIKTKYANKYRAGEDKQYCYPDLDILINKFAQTLYRHFLPSPA